MRLRLGFLLIAACAESTPPPRSAPAAVPSLADCCVQCRQSAQRDPAGMDIRSKPCSSYPPEWNGAAGVDDSCRVRLQEARVTVGDCQSPTKNP